MEEYDDDGDTYWANLDKMIATYDDPRVINKPVVSKAIKVEFQQPASQKLDGKGTKWMIGPCRTAEYRRIDKRILPPSVVPIEVRNSQFNRHMDILPNPSTAVSMPLVNGDVTTGFVVRLTAPTMPIHSLVGVSQSHASLKQRLAPKTRL